MKNRLKFNFSLDWKPFENLKFYSKIYQLVYFVTLLLNLSTCIYNNFKVCKSTKGPKRKRLLRSLNYLILEVNDRSFFLEAGWSLALPRRVEVELHNSALRQLR